MRLPGVVPHPETDLAIAELLRETLELTDLSRQAHYGAAHGVFGTIHDVGDAIGPITAGGLVASVGYTRMFQLITVVVLLATATFAVVSRSEPTRGATAAAGRPLEQPPNS